MIKRMYILKHHINWTVCFNDDPDNLFLDSVSLPQAPETELLEFITEKLQQELLAAIPKWVLKGQS